LAPFVHLIHSVDSKKLLKEINKEAKKNNRMIDCLLQVYIAKEETKFGLDQDEAEELISRISGTDSNDEKLFQNVRVKGLMGMASFTDDKEVVRKEFQGLKVLFDKWSAFSLQPPAFSVLSMGMSSDYEMAIAEGSNMVRIGSLLFGKREQKK
jgi:pyridoxal phosphate enzyme (YggS family)